MSKADELNKLAEKITGENPQKRRVSEVIDFIVEKTTGNTEKHSSISEALSYMAENYGGDEPTPEPEPEPSLVLEVGKKYNFTAKDNAPAIENPLTNTFSIDFYDETDETTRTGLVELTVRARGKFDPSYSDDRLCDVHITVSEMMDGEEYPVMPGNWTYFVNDGWYDTYDDAPQSASANEINSTNYMKNIQIYKLFDYGTRTQITTLPAEATTVLLNYFDIIEV